MRIFEGIQLIKESIHNWFSPRLPLIKVKYKLTAIDLTNQEALDAGAKAK